MIDIKKPGGPGNDFDEMCSHHDNLIDELEAAQAEIEKYKAFVRAARDYDTTGSAAAYKAREKADAALGEV